ncbi:hypothetical protein JJE66_16175 [Bradyrhizobium diazoefficiens]|nr:asparagine synthase C-terminal domain-containing protein [Bradyrhizobium diazoefficiens]MBK3662766.1 hypothetical protein [Bradyrhizobium diazoefficiens]
MFHDIGRVEANTFPWSGNVDIARQALDPSLIAELDFPSYLEAEYRSALAEVPALTGSVSADRNEHRMREICYLFLTRFLPTLLDRLDRLSMASGLEVRVPYGDHRLVEYVFGSPWAHKSFDSREKSLLRAASADLLPRSVVQRVKSVLPSIQDPHYYDMLRTRFIALLNDRNAAIRPLLSVNGSRGLLNAADNVRWTQNILALQDFLADYKVSLAL